MKVSTNAAGQRIVELENADVVLIRKGVRLRVHPRQYCDGEPCCIHNPSNHAMVTFPLDWHSDLGLMVRVCPHGRAHPDPDSLMYLLRVLGPRHYQERALGIHGCDGCCSRWVEKVGSTVTRSNVNLIRDLVAGIKAHDELSEHAALIATSDPYGQHPCMPCARYTAALLRGVPHNVAVKQACDVLRRCAATIQTAREAVDEWELEQ